MGSMNQCPFCGEQISSYEKKCPNCGGPNEYYVEHRIRLPYAPKTIGEMKAYCSRRGMPLPRMRFFLGGGLPAAPGLRHLSGSGREFCGV